MSAIHLFNAFDLSKYATAMDLGGEYGGEMESWETRVSLDGECDLDSEEKFG